MKDRNVKGYWWTWAEGQEWPSWYYGEKVAKEAAARIARGNPGCRVMVGNLTVMETVTLPDKLVRSS